MSHEPQEPLQRPTWVRWYIVALLVGYSFMTWFNRVGMSVAYTEHIKREAGIEPTQIGWVYSAFLISYMICMIPGGLLIDRYGPWAGLVLMGFGSAAYCALTALAGLPALISAGWALATLLIVRTLMGAFTAPIYPAASRLTANWIPLGQRTQVNGLIQAAAAIGIAFSFHLFGGLMDVVGWQAAFLIAGAVTGVLALFWTMYAADDPARHRFTNGAERELIGGISEECGNGSQSDKVASPPTRAGDQETGIRVQETAIRRQETGIASREVSGSRDKSTGEPSSTAKSIEFHPPWYELLKKRNLVLLTMSYAAVGYVEYLFFFWAQFYFKDVLNLSTDDSRTYSMILNLSLGGGMVLGGWLADRLRLAYGGRWGRAAVPMIGLLASGGLLLAGVLVENIVAIVALLSLALVAIGTTEAPTWTLAVELGGRHGGTAAAICNTSGNAVGLIAPILTPYVNLWITRQFEVSDKVGWQWAISLGSAIAVLGAMMWLGITPEKTADHPNAAEPE